MLVSYWLLRAYSLKTEAIDGTVICTINFQVRLLLEKHVLKLTNVM